MLCNIYSYAFHHIKMRPFQIVINNRPTTSKAIDKMLETGSIERYMSPWYCVVEILEKTDGTKRLWVEFRNVYLIQ